MKLHLVVQTPGKTEGKVIPITLPQFLIGRDPLCQLRPASAVISKRHCALLTKGEEVFIRDFDSTNGTFVNDQPIKGELQLHHADKLKVGPLLFEVRIEKGAPVNEPTPVPPTKAQSPGAGTKTPLPPTKAPPPAKIAVSTGSEDDDMAAMLLSIDDGTPGSGSASDIVPEGSTVMDIPSPFGPPDGKAADKEKEKKKVPTGNTSNAAKDILEKYMKRPRS